MTRDPSVFVHERALCESGEIGPRTRIWAFAHVMRGARVGTDCNICGHVFVEARRTGRQWRHAKKMCRSGTRLSLMTMCLSGPAPFLPMTSSLGQRSKSPLRTSSPTFVKQGATIGANATIVCGVTIGPQAFVGAGGVVTKDVPLTPWSSELRPSWWDGSARAAGSCRNPSSVAAVSRSAKSTMWKDFSSSERLGQTDSPTLCL